MDLSPSKKVNSKLVLKRRVKTPAAAWSLESEKDLLPSRTRFFVVAFLLLNIFFRYMPLYGGEVHQSFWDSLSWRKKYYCGHQTFTTLLNEKALWKRVCVGDFSIFCCSNSKRVKCGENDWLTVWGESRRRKNCVQGPGEIVYWARGGKKSGTFHPPPKWVGKYVHEWGENWRGIVLLQIHTYTVYSTVANLFSTSSFFNNNSLRNSDKVDKLNRVWFKRKQKSDLHLNYQLDG